MPRIAIAMALLSIVLTGCARKESAPATSGTSSETSSTSSTAVNSTTVTTTASAATDSQEPSLISFSSGALIEKKPQELDQNWSAFRILDEKPTTGWATPENVVAPQTMVIALAEKTEINRLEFDTEHTDGEHRDAKDLSVEISDVSATSGFQKLADVSLKEKTDKQSFPVASPKAGRWVRLSIKNNWGAPDYIELMDFRAFGKQLTRTPFANASGTYATDYGNFHLKQEGTSVTGCYEHGGGLLTGGIEGRIMKFTWTEDGENKNGPAIMVFDPTGQQMFGLWWYAGDTQSPGSDWNGKKISNDVGSCPHWKGTGAEATMQKELEAAGRTRVYGINFDTGSDVIRDESKPTIDKMAAMLKAKPEWKLTIEGHTDSSGGDTQNVPLSQRRADSVKAYLVTAGIAADRLTAKGFGSSKPLAGNETATGRAQNRRVELAKE
ncbi:MAG: OmpA-OmpF porin, family [Thermoanaerobaculia bacterium]|jgi:outer membrane protein OmpA-like peptidoglycan-associated protein|nr:OmpA-OmpF porin, family [Thermoanaerobaculia bacterium]